MNESYIRLSLQRALLGAVTPNLRLVYFLENEKNIELVFIYITPPSENERELASIVETEVISDFPPPKYVIHTRILTKPYSTILEKVGNWVYHVCEG